MANIRYTVNQDTPQSIPNLEVFSQEDTSLANTFQINQLFNSNNHSIELHIYNLAGELLESDYNYTSYKELGSAASAGKEGASTLSINPIADVELYGYDNGGVKLFYNFINDLYTEGRSTVEFFISEISPDRTEIKLNTFNLTSEQIQSFTSNIRQRLETQSYFNEFRLNLQNNDLLIGVNIDTLQEAEDTVLVVKLYEALPEDIVEKSTLSIVELLGDSVVYEVTSTVLLEEEPTPTLRSANFNLEITDDSVIPTEYYNYDSLLSLPISNTTNELYSLVSSKGVQLSIDHSDYGNFIHFSSAQERLLNFKYKLDLIQTYNTQISNFQTITTPSPGTTGSIKYYQDLVKGIVSNFDHYERFLYYESGSNSWPKTNIVKPYINDTTSATGSWFTAKLTAAATYDVQNTNILTNSIPSYLRDDPANTNYITFIHMIGQHFDNMWIYAKGVSDKYNADNRLDFGISRDLIAEVLKNFGVKLYTSNKSVQDLFSTFVGQAYQSGSEIINTYITGSVTGSNTSIQPSSLDNYQREIYKRIYHNLPLLLKSKGTERGLRALINCFGIPSDILDIKVYGGRNTSERPFYGDYRYYTSSLGKVRLDATGSVVTGNTLSQYTSITKRDGKYTDDLHPIEVGFSPTDNVDNYIISKSLATASLASFNIDDYLGDPRNLYLSNYYTLTPTGSVSGNLQALTEQIMSGSNAYNIQDFVRLIKFFDNTIFKMVKDFIPARSVADTGIVIKPHLLQRNKAKSVQVEVEQPEYTGSIGTAFITGSDGSSFGAKNTYNTSYRSLVQTPSGLSIQNYHNNQQPKYNGEFSNSRIQVTGADLTRANIYKNDTFTSQQLFTTLIQDFPTNICVIQSSYTPVTVTSHAPRDIRQDFSNLGTTGVVFITGSVDITSQAPAYTFPNINYVQYEITASRPDLESCSGSIQYNIAYCDIQRVINPLTIQSGSQTVYNLTSWFTAGSNTNTSFTASWSNNVVGISNPTNYVFTQPVGQVTITRKDNIIEGCQQSVVISIIQPGVTYTRVGDFRPSSPCTAFVEIVQGSNGIYYTLDQGGLDYVEIYQISNYWYSRQALYLGDGDTGISPGSGTDTPNSNNQVLEGYQYTRYETNETSTTFTDVGFEISQCAPF